MNTQSKSNAITKFLTAGIVAVLLIVANPFTGKASTNNEKGNTRIADNQVSVQYTGTSDEAVTFKVQFANPEAQKFTLTIKNDAGDVLYRGHFNNANFSKTIHLLNEDTEMNPVFIISMGDQKIERSFNVNKTTGTTEEVVVNKI
ncbi:hypothetical protein SAMN05421788_1011278 [Filimonas lacunae]|uniref:Uncharacterized protein n=1 Tax=Filimonas lacunae TaxID=477680 RepID=A0A173MQ87_9BACT|nr:hypothetical protein [Filimonas lacunae]BAV09845.1 hypothetical protein FLA_5898 [Filimonas lacunae]SIS79834.1 hypothetical protein SAMN05421788_1011278 [Filimonas lacunae]